MGAGASVSNETLIKYYQDLLKPEDATAISVSQLVTTLGLDESTAAKLYGLFLACHGGEAGSQALTKKKRKLAVAEGIKWRDWAVVYDMNNTRFYRKMFASLCTRGQRANKDPTLDCRDYMLGVFKLCTCTTLVMCRYMFKMYASSDGSSISKKAIVELLADLYDMQKDNPELEKISTELLARFPKKASKGCTMEEWIKGLRGEGGLQTLKPAFAMNDRIKQYTMGREWWQTQTDKIDVILKLKDRMDIDDLVLSDPGLQQTGDINDWLNNKNRPEGYDSGGGEEEEAQSVKSAQGEEKDIPPEEGVTGTPTPTGLSATEAAAAVGDTAAAEAAAAEAAAAAAAAPLSKTSAIAAASGAMVAAVVGATAGVPAKIKRHKRGTKERGWRDGGRLVYSDNLCLDPMNPTEEEEHLVDLLERSRRKVLQVSGRLLLQEEEEKEAEARKVKRVEGPKS